MALADKAESSSQLLQALEGENVTEALIDSVCQDLQHKAADAEVLQQTDGKELNFALFSNSPALSKFLLQSMPVVWLTQLAIWPTLTSNFLQMIHCTPMEEDRAGEVVSVQRLFLHPDMECWQDAHMSLAAVAVAGLSVWSLGLPFCLFLRIWSLQDRQDSENFRKYGYFIRGLEPRYWYWDLLVKRVDTLSMLVVAKTSIADDDNAKLLLFPLISGLVLAINNWIKPYSNSQSAVLDAVEFCLLLARFLLFSSVSMLLIFFPKSGTLWELS